MKKILLMGNPNVGKSIFFTELTGVHAVSSNFAGTTVDLMEGKLRLGKDEFALIDVPGTYSLDPSSEAEAVASHLMEEGAAAVICVIDASNLERNLNLVIEIKKYNIPVVCALNMSDVAERQGIFVNEKLLEQELGLPVVKTIAVKKVGFDDLVESLRGLLESDFACEKGCANCSGCKTISSTAKEINARVVQKNSSSLSFLDKLGIQMIKPFPGFLIAIFVLVALVGVVVFGGRMLRMPLIMLTDGVIVPLFRSLFEWIFAQFSGGTELAYRYLYYDGGFVTRYRVFICYSECGWFSAPYELYSTVSNSFSSVLLNVLIGEYGIFVISFQWIIALILPYVFSFYLAITFLEDSGYLPRVSILFDNIMRKLGIQGGSLIHVFLGLGCAIPAILGSRTATTIKEKKMIAVIICFAVPCISQIGALVALMGAFSWWMSVVMLLFALFLFVVTAFIAGKIIKGRVDPLIMEVPNLLLPSPKTYFRKLWIRMKHFLKDAEVPMLLAVFIAAVLAGTGVLAAIARQPQVQGVVSGWLGMPEEAVVSLILGVVRREMSVAPLLILNLTYLQVFVAGVVSLLYLPCLSVFGVLAKEFKLKFALAIFAGTIFTAIFVGGLINQIGGLFL
jgi:ferrous iron transport protein B